MMKRHLAFSALLFLSFCCLLPSQAAEFNALRQKMVQEVIAAAGSTPPSARVMAAMGKVERHRFVPGLLEALAYRNHPLPIGHGQTISQPLIVARMTDLLEIGKDDNVLEIGTGSGYQAAVLAELTRSVHTMEIIEPLARQAAIRLRSLGYGNVHTRLGDGYYGWPDAAPFDAIMVTAAASHVPPALLEQLKPGGRMVIPLGAQFMTQYLMLVEKQPDGTIRTRQIVPVSFVPLTGGH